MNVLDDHRKIHILRKLWPHLAEGVPIDHITQIMGIPLESFPNKKYSPTYYIAHLPLTGDERPPASRVLEELQPGDNDGHPDLWLNMLTANGLTSLNACEIGRRTGESPEEDGMRDS
jgi:hypothetical protein